MRKTFMQIGLGIALGAPSLARVLVRPTTNDERLTTNDRHKGVHHGITRESFDTGPGQPQ